MKKIALFLLATALLAGCGASPTLSPTLGNASTRLTARSDAPFRECLVTDEATIKLQDAIRIFMQANAWKASLEKYKSLAVRPVASGKEYRMTCIFSNGTPYEATVMVTVNQASVVLAMKESGNRDPVVLLPFKQATANQLQTLSPKVASYLKAEWDSELVSVKKGTILEGATGNVYRLEAAIKSSDSPVAVEASLEVRLAPQWAVVEVESR